MANDSQGLDDEALHDYSVIYHWHRLHGIEEYERKYPQDVARETPPFQKYRDFLERMPPPDEADLAAMSEVVHEMLTSSMGWSGLYQVETGLTLLQVARRLRAVLESTDSSCQ